MSSPCDRLIATLLEQLTAQERQRAGCFACTQALHLFVLSHATLHWALRKAGLHGYSFAVTAQGKPYLADHSEFYFNLSHTEGLIAVALSPHHPIGVDVERLASRQTYCELATRVMTAAECADMAVQDAPEDRFTQLWSAKEAVMKATGLGFALPPREVEFAGPKPRLTRLPPALGAVQDWQVCTQRLPGHWLALAARDRALVLNPIYLTPQDLLV